MIPKQQFVCVHGHFYQPPRENPWTGRIEPQPTAAPYANWNERVCAECYAPNAAARILDPAGHIIARESNYNHISFDFGPTLLSWLEAEEPDTYAAILAADRLSHGGMAQAYNHIIMPLANARDRATQVLWGSFDFQHRFGREPEGMWLPETAVDVPTLEDLAAAGLHFTVLAPRQAARVRHLGSRQWTDVSGGRVDPRFAYEVRLPSERRMVVFFYDAGLAQGVAFENLLNDGRRLADRLVAALGTRPDHSALRWREVRLASVATDGETYGHHHRFGEMALAVALRELDTRPDIVLTTYRSFLATHPPVAEVEIIEDTSWSCAHGVERWRSDCGCCTGAHPGWHQAWRAPLRASLDWLRDQLAAAYQRAGGRLVWNVWNARNRYIEVLLDRHPRVAQTFLAQHSRYPLNPSEQARLWQLLEMQRHAMLMFTSCGWFFDDISGLEASQVLAYAARAIELARQAFDLDLESDFLRLLEAAPSNLPEFRTGRGIFEQVIRPLMGAAQNA